MKVIRKENLIAMAIAAFALLFLPIATTTTNQVFAQTPQEDINGIELMQPYGAYTLTYSTQWFQTNNAFDENFIEGGTGLQDSIRLRFEDTSSASLMMAGYFKLSPNSCTTNPGQEASWAVNGGVHSDDAPQSPGVPGDTTTEPEPNQNYADTMWLDLRYDGTDSRFRFERWHVQLSDEIPPGTSPAQAIPIGQSLCSINTGDASRDYFGLMIFKTNIDTDCDGTKDRWIIRGYYDVSGLGTDGKPQNNWELYWVKTFYPPTYVSNSVDENKIKAWLQPWVHTAPNIDGDFREQFIRFDQQDITDWTDSDPNYKFFTLKQASATTNSCGSGVATSEIIDPAMTAEALSGGEEEIAVSEDEDTVTQTDEEEVTQSEETDEEEEEEEELAQEDDPQDPDNNDTTADDEEEEEEEQ